MKSALKAEAIQEPGNLRLAYVQLRGGIKQVPGIDRVPVATVPAPESRDIDRLDCILNLPRQLSFFGVGRAQHRPLDTGARLGAETGMVKKKKRPRKLWTGQTPRG